MEDADREEWDEGGEGSGEETVAPSGTRRGGSVALSGVDPEVAAPATCGRAPPHSGQNFPGVTTSRLQDGQTGIGLGGYRATRFRETD